MTVEPGWCCLTLASLREAGGYGESAMSNSEPPESASLIGYNTRQPVELLLWWHRRFCCGHFWSKRQKGPSRVCETGLSAEWNDETDLVTSAVRTATAMRAATAVGASAAGTRRTTAPAAATARSAARRRVRAR